MMIDSASKIPPSADLISLSNPVIVGKLGSSYGVKGWIKVNSFTDPLDNLLDYSPWYVERQGKWFPLNVLEGRLYGKGLIVHLEGYDTPEDVKHLAGLSLAVERGQFPELDEGEFYLDDLEGLRVETLNNVFLGTVSQVITTGAHEVLVITGERERMIPLVMDIYIKKVDVEKGLILVDWDPDF